MGSSTPAPTTTTQINKTELPAWVDQASQQNYQFAQQVADRPFQQYGGPLVAGQNATEQSAVPILQQGMAGSGTAYDAASKAIGGVAGYTAPQVAGPAAVGNVTAGTLPTTDISKYLNPYTQNVVDTTLAGMDRASAGALQANDDASRSQGAWGGSRSGVQQAVLQSENIRNKAATEANLRSTAYTTATGQAQADNQSVLQAALANQSKDTTANAQNIQVGTANQNASLAGANLGLQAGTAMQGLGDSITNSAGKNSLLASQLGANARGVEQAGIDAAKGQFDERYNAPLTALNTRMAALGMSPYGKTTTSEGTSQGGTSSNTTMQALGIGAALLPMMFSDRNVKKDVKRLGKVPGSELNAYEFKYKKGFMGRDMPKQVGLMAQDVEKKVPGAVKKVKVGDKSVRAVDYGAALAGSRKGGKGFMGARV